MSRLFLPAGINYLLNPSLTGCEDGLPDNWTENSALTLFTEFASVGGSATGARFQYTRAGAVDTHIAFARSVAGTFASGDKATFSCYLAGTPVAHGSFIIRIVAWDVADGFLDLTQSSAITLSSTPQRAVLTHTCPANTSYVSCQIYATQIDMGDTVDYVVSGAQLEKSPLATPYFDGSMQPTALNAATYAWTAAANASTSTRAASVLAAAASWTSTSAGTIALRCSPYHNWTGSTAYGNACLLQVGEAAGNRVHVGLESPGKVWTFINGTTDKVESGTVTWTQGDNHSVISRWATGASGTLDQMVDGTAASQVAHTQTTTALNSTYFGANHTPAAFLNGYLGAVLISPQRKSDAWVTAVDTLLRASVVDIPTLKRVYMSPGDALFTGEQADGSNLYVKGS